MRSPRIDTTNPMYETVRFIYDDINAVERRVESIAEDTRTPDENEGSVGDQRVIFDGATIYLYIKTSRGWKKTTLT